MSWLDIATFFGILITIVFSVTLVANLASHWYFKHRANVMRQRRLQQWRRRT